MKRTVFISHASVNRATAEQICGFLEKNGIPCWIAPRDVTPGKNYGLAIVDAIDECAVFLLLLTSESNKSGQVVREVERAASANAIIIPFRTEDIAPSRNLEFYVSSAHWLDAITPPLDKHLRQLLQAIKNWQANEVEKEESTTTVVSSPRPETAPPPLPPSRSPFFAGQRGRMIAIAGGILLLGLLLIFALTRHRAEKPEAAIAETPTTVATSSPMPTMTATATATVSATATVAPTPIETASAATARRRPGEPLHSPSPSDAQSTPPASPVASTPTLRPGQPLGSATTPAVSAVMPAPVVREVVASSQRGPEHRPGMVVDGDLKTSWMTKSEGVGQSVSVNFKTPATITSVSIFDGNGLEPGFHACNRAHKVRLMLSDGSVQVLELEDKPGVQRFDVNHRVAGEWARFEILSVYPGKKNNWTAISEIQFNR